MDIQHIRYFLEIVKHESFSKAADALFVTQPILTRCVKNMEQELGVSLITRSTKTFALTDAGQTLVEYGQPLVEQYDDIFRHIQDVEQAKTGQVRISSPGVLQDMYFPKLMTDYRRQHPGVHIHIRESGSRLVVQDVLEGKADIGLVMLPLEETAMLTVYPLVEDQVHVLVRKDHPFANRKTVQIKDLEQADMITYDKSNTLYHTFCAMCREQGFTPTIAFQSMMPNFILDTITYGSCVGIFPAPMLRQFPRQELVSIPLEPGFPWQIAMVVSKKRYLSYAARDFLSFATDYLTKKKG